MMKEKKKQISPSDSHVHQRQRKKNWVVGGVLFVLFCLFYVMSIAKLKGY